MENQTQEVPKDVNVNVPQIRFEGHASTWERTLGSRPWIPIKHTLVPRDNSAFMLNFLQLGRMDLYTAKKSIRYSIPGIGLEIEGEVKLRISWKPLSMVPYSNWLAPIHATIAHHSYVPVAIWNHVRNYPGEANAEITPEKKSKLNRFCGEVWRHVKKANPKPALKWLGNKTGLYKNAPPQEKTSEKPSH
jgi:hypothetical protein